MAHILVVGSANTDLVVKTDRFPKPGETLVGGDFYLFQGGKGANQAVTAARMGAQVSFVCKLGRDSFGTQTKNSLSQEGISTEWILEDPDHASGIATITINASGENQIIVAPGTNAHLSSDNLDAASSALLAADLVLCQLEIPLPTVIHLAKKCQNTGKRLVLNPAPAQQLPEALLHNLFLLTPNETEAASLSGTPCTVGEDYPKIARWFLDKGVQNILITLGEKGSYFENAEQSFFTPAPKANPIDTTAAGDVFNGALSVALVEGMDWKVAIQTASRAAAISVTRMGAQASIPYRNEVF